MTFARSSILVSVMLGAAASLGCSGDAQGFAATDTAKCPEPPLYRIVDGGAGTLVRRGLDGKPLTSDQLATLQQLADNHCGVTPAGTAISPFKPDAGK